MNNLKRILFPCIIMAGMLLLTGNAFAFGKPEVTVFVGQDMPVNSYILNDGTSIVVIDVQRSSKDGMALAEKIRATGLPLTQIIITHGHPDHYLGLGAMHAAFPKAEIVVAAAVIKQEIMGFTAWMEGQGWLEAEPAMKRKSAGFADGFDYAGLIKVAEANFIRMSGGERLDLSIDYLPSEAEHITTVYSKSLNAVFSSDLVYDKVFLWMGPGVDAAHLTNWKTNLQKMQQEAGKKLTIYPGHGPAGDTSLLQKNLDYIETFERVVAEADSKEEAIGKMKAAYPGWESADFLLQYSIDFHVQK